MLNACVDSAVLHRKSLLPCSPWARLSWVPRPRVSEYVPCVGAANGSLELCRVTVRPLSPSRVFLCQGPSPYQKTSILTLVKCFCFNRRRFFSFPVRQQQHHQFQLREQQPVGCVHVRGEPRHPRRLGAALRLRGLRVQPVFGRVHRGVRPRGGDWGWWGRCGVAGARLRGAGLGCSARPRGGRCVRSARRECWPLCGTRGQTGTESAFPSVTCPPPPARPQSQVALCGR